MRFCFLVRNFALSISFAYIYTDTYLFVHGLNVSIYLTRVFPVLSTFLSCFTRALSLHTALLQPSCKEGNKACAWQNKVESNPCIAALCHFCVHHSLPSVCSAVCNGLESSLPSALCFQHCVNCLWCMGFSATCSGKGQLSETGLSTTDKAFERLDLTH